MRIIESARKHQIADEDMLHAIRNALRTIDQNDDTTFIIGPGRDGGLLEIVISTRYEEPVVIHAMKLRDKFHNLL